MVDIFLIYVKITDDDFIQLVQNSEEQRHVQADLICSKLDNIVTSIEALTAAQIATTVAIEKLAMALSYSQ